MLAGVEQPVFLVKDIEAVMQPAQLEGITKLLQAAEQVSGAKEEMRQV